MNIFSQTPLGAGAHPIHRRRVHKPSWNWSSPPVRYSEHYSMFWRTSTLPQRGRAPCFGGSPQIPGPTPPPVDAARRPNAAHAGRPDLIPKAWCGRCQLQCFDRASEPPPPGGVRNQHVSCPYHPTVFGLLGPGLDGGILLRLTTIHGWLHARYKLAHNGEAFAWKGGKLKL